jgi:HD-GYP domain-containing protein (c-di-GMP phosphodiesterase class II)
MNKDHDSTQELKEIFEIARSISSVLDVDMLLKRIDATAERLLNAEASSIMLLDDDKQSLYFKVASGEKGGVIQRMKIKIGEGIAGTVAKERKPLIVNDATKDSRFNTQMDKASGFVTRSIICVPMIIEEDLIGVVEVLNKREGKEFTKDDVEILVSLASLAAISICNAKSAEDQRNFFVNMIEILISAIESRDIRMSGHSWKVAQLSTAIGKVMGLKGNDYKNLYYGALLHDIGLLSIKDKLSLEDGILTVKDRNPETNHPRFGEELVRNINVLKGAATIIRHHHENYDGTGYPDRLVSDDIPLGARIVALAEAVEEMRFSGYSNDRINQLLKLGQDTRFDPDIVRIYLKEFADSKI